MGWTMIVTHGLSVVALAWWVGNYVLLSVSIITAQIKGDLEFPQDKQYLWKTGQWGVCTGEECGPAGMQSRSVWCVHVDGWAAQHSDCWHTQRPESRRRCFRVCEWHRDLFQWEMSDWSPCGLAGVGQCVTAQHGVQRRIVHCVRRDNGTVEAPLHVCEHFSPRPPLEQACLVPCPLPCVLSHFSAWSGCSRTCGGGLQHRSRVVLAAPVYGGGGCPNLTQTRACPALPACPSGDALHHYSLKAGAWSPCRLPHQHELWSGRTTLDFSSHSLDPNRVRRHSSQHHRHHGNLPSTRPGQVQVGYQTRQVRCTRSDGKNVMLSLCLQESPPVTHQACVLPQDCQTHAWSPWSPCSKTCRAADLLPGYRWRRRSLRQLPVGGGKACPALEEREACNIFGDLLPSCPKYIWKSTDWGPCQISPLLSQQDLRHSNLSMLCGGGIQTREIYCVLLVENKALHAKEGALVEFHTMSRILLGVGSRPVNSRLCGGPRPPSAQACSVPCPQECVLSHWSAWSPCRYDNCSEPQARKGYRQRRRHALWDLAAASPDCPHLTEFIPCEDPACFLWHVASDSCVPSQGPCGPGVRNRTVLCTDTLGYSTGGDVPSELCPEEQPAQMSPCEVPCPGDCVVSSWSHWSQCSHSCSSRAAEGRQSRVRTTLAAPGEGGKPCPAAPALEDWRLCNQHPCAVFYWETSAWGVCTHNASASDQSGTAVCGIGIQTRRVSCVKFNVGAVTLKRCPESSRPDRTRPCLLPCKKDCMVTPFSEWTACPSTCGQANATASAQSRYRITIQHSANGGLECPDTLYEERECEARPVCPVYRWKPHRWQLCAMVPDSVRQGIAGSGESCGPGLEIRSVECVGEPEEPADVSQCVRWAGVMPPVVRACHVPCREDCAVSNWSTFSECSTCGGWRSRRRSLTGRSKKREKCHNFQQFPLEETEPCTCAEFLLRPYGNWSSCILPSSRGWRAQRDPKECGQGLRYRAVACTDHSERLVEPEHCNSTGYVEELCHIPCPLDCRLSEWSAWSACSVSCGSGVKVRSKWLREKPFNGGRPCPKLDLKNQVYEAVPCHSGCSQYTWAADAWSLCTINTVDTQTSCGEGVQSRKIKCVRVGDTPVQVVNDSYCEQEDIPVGAQTCLLPCPDDCVMSEWSVWSECPQPCDQNTVRARRRQTLRLSHAGKLCPIDIQTESCILNSTCFSYRYNLSDWSSCLLSENAICGQGRMSRQLDCVRSDGKVVQPSLCQQIGVSQTFTLHTQCVHACPVNCLLSDWSAWSECSHTCGSLGHMGRTRVIIQQAHEEGRPCPSQLSQHKPCPVRPCYQWVLSDWSPCLVEGAECGEGIRERSLTCVVHWGDSRASSFLPVSEEKCEDKLRKARGDELHLSCSVPCPGDCHLTEWSSWSSCQLTCLNGRSFETTGQQSRSRAVVIQVPENQDSCPQQVFETQPCQGGKCYSYEWKTSGWRDNERQVWCQRSDGLNVTGGCFLQARPPTIRHCYPPCTKPFSYCTQSGVCGCEMGYTEVMTTHGFLDYCTKTPGAENKKADVKTNSGRFNPGNTQIHSFTDDWSLRPVGPDGRLKLWVYGVTAGGFVVLLVIMGLSFFMCRKVRPKESAVPPQKPLTLAYDGDADM